MKFDDAIENLKMISVAFVDPVTQEQLDLIDDTITFAINAINTWIAVRSICDLAEMMVVDEYGADIPEGYVEVVELIDKIVKEKYDERSVNNENITKGQSPDQTV